MSLSLGLALAGALAAAACGSSERSGFGSSGSSNGGPGSSGDLGGGPGVTSDDALALEPAETLLDVGDGKPPASADLKAFVVKKDGTRLDVTAAAKFYVDDPPGAAYGSFAGPRFTPGPSGAGRMVVHAKYQSLLGDAVMKLRLTKTVVAAGAPADAPSKFGGAADAARKPSFVYPADGVMVPPNTNELEWQFQPGAGNDLFELSVKGSMLDLRVYFACNTKIGAGCGWTPDPSVWAMMSGGGRGDDPLTTTMRGASAAGGSVGTSAAQAISFGEEDILGGLYYWNAGAGATMRYEFGKSGQTAETWMNAPKAGAATCVGCHVLSRDGERVALGLDIPGPAAFKVFDVATRTPLYAKGGAAGGSGANFFTFSPDRAQLLASNGVTMTLQDAANGNALQADMGQGAMPDWSPDGKAIVFAKSKTPPPCFGVICSSTGVVEASLFAMTKGSGPWGNPTVLVPSSGQNNFYPAYAPDGAWVLFNRASVGKDVVKNEEKSSYDAPDASLWTVKASGGAPIALAKAGSPNGDSWPKWMPREQAWRGKKLMWFTFSSRRAYGLRQEAGKNAQIWMAAFDPSATAESKDGSFAAFRLPFQELGSGNHTAQWVTKVVRKGCTDAAACEGGEICQDGACRPLVK
jgi:hypothetical protein